MSTRAEAVQEIQRVGSKIGGSVCGRSYYASSVILDVERLLAAFHFESDTFVLRNVAEVCCRALVPVIERLADEKVRGQLTVGHLFLDVISVQSLLSYASEVRDDDSDRRRTILRTVRIVLDDVRRSLNAEE